MSRPPVILALDLATVTGWAYGPAGARPRFGTWKLGKPGTPRPARLLVLRGYLADFLAVNDNIDEVAYEAPMKPRVMARVGSTPDTAILLLSACAVAEIACYEAGVDYSMHDVQAVREHFTGQRRYRDQWCPIELKTVSSREWAKRATIARCKQLGSLVRNDNEADAVALHDYVASVRYPPAALRGTPLFGSAA